MSWFPDTILGFRCVYFVIFLYEILRFVMNTFKDNNGGVGGVVRGKTRLNSRYKRKSRPP